MAWWRKEPGHQQLFYWLVCCFSSGRVNMQHVMMILILVGLVTDTLKAVLGKHTMDPYKTVTSSRMIHICRERLWCLPYRKCVQYISYNMYNVHMILLYIMTSSNGNWPLNSQVTGEFPHKGQWRGVLMFSLICVCINSWVNNGEAGDLRCHHTHYDIIVMLWFVVVVLPVLNSLAPERCGSQ